MSLQIQEARFFCCKDTQGTHLTNHQLYTFFRCQIEDIFSTFDYLQPIEKILLELSLKVTIEFSELFQQGEIGFSSKL